MTRKRMVGWMTGWACALIGLALLIPGLVVQRIIDAEPTPPPGQEEAVQPLPAGEGIVIPVLLSGTGKIERVSLETYVRGVVAAEMPIDFELEALKAQAIAARTYILRRMQIGDYSDIGVEGAVVSDTAKHQAYLSERELQRKWPWFLRGRYMNKLNRAIRETEGLVLTYQGELIQASYFSTSNGYTEDSEAYWQNAIPYLRSVPSPWDEQSPKYKASKTFALEDLKTKLELPASLGESELAQVSVLERTAGQRVKSVRIGGKVFTGREVRERLGLASSHFDWKWKDGKVEITTYGYGHGVGMSQYGAQGMAREGRSAEEILRYYYQGVEINSMNNFVIPQV